jgi:hypothetical protein
MVSASFRQLALFAHVWNGHGADFIEAVPFFMLRRDWTDMTSTALLLRILEAPVVLNTFP